MRRHTLTLAVLAMLSVGCANDETSSPCAPSQYVVTRTFADLCLKDKLRAVSAIDHEQPSEGAIREIVEFCERQYPGPEVEP